MEKNNKCVMNITGLHILDEEQLGMLIDNLVEYYTKKFGLDLSIEQPEKPEFEVENLDVAKDYLKKYRLNG